MKIDNTKTKASKTVYYGDDDLAEVAQLDTRRVAENNWLVLSVSEKAIKFVSTDDDLEPHSPHVIVLTGDIRGLAGDNQRISVGHPILGSQLAAIINALSDKMSVSVNMSATSSVRRFYTVEVTKK